MLQLEAAPRHLLLGSGYTHGIVINMMPLLCTFCNKARLGRYRVETIDFGAGKQLSFKSFHSDLDGRLGKRYTASRRDCGPCPHKPTCAPHSKKRQLIRTATLPTTSAP